MKKIQMFGVFGEGITEASVFDQLPQDGKEDLVIELNSPGGDIDIAKAIYNRLKEYQGNKTVDVLAQAASAASYVAMAGDEIVMRRNARMMIHNPYTFAFGNAKKMEKTIEQLKIAEDELVNVYAQRTGQTPEKVRKLMDDETWMDAKKAVSLGFATKVADEPKEKVKTFREFMISNYKHTPSLYALLDEEVEASELTPIEFTTEPYEIGSEVGYNINGIRYKIAVGEGVELQNLKVRFEKTDSRYSKFRKVDLLIGGQVYSLNEGEIQMLTQITNLLKVDSPEKAIEAIKALQTSGGSDTLVKVQELLGVDSPEKIIAAIESQRKDGTADKDFQARIDAAMASIEAKVEAKFEGKLNALVTDNQLKAKMIDDLVDDKRAKILERRLVELNNLLEKEFCINPNQLSEMKKAYVDIGHDLVEATEASFTQAVQVAKLAGPVYKGMTELHGTGADGVVSGDVTAKVEAEIQKILKDNQGMTYDQAFNKLVNEQPKLMEEYNDHVTARGE